MVGVADTERGRWRERGEGQGGKRSSAKVVEKRKRGTVGIREGGELKETTEGRETGRTVAMMMEGKCSVS